MTHVTLPAHFTPEYVAEMSGELEKMSLGDMLTWIVTNLPSLFQVTSFGATGMVIIHALSELRMKVPVIFLDTLYHFPETIDHAEAVQERYELDARWYRCSTANNREEFERKYKCDDMWISHPKRYEWLTKVEPLERGLKENNVLSWVTGRRRDQGGLRTSLPILEIDSADGRIKVNLLAHWTKQMVWDYLKKFDIPYNPLFDKNYASVGDIVNTIRTDSAQGEREGRFFQFGGVKTECGIHVRSSVSVPL